MSDKCPDCDSTHVEFERSSGYAGWRCKECGSWHYAKNDENPTGCKSTELEARIATLEAQLAAAREVITADDEYFEIPRGFDVLLTTDGVDARQACRRARKAAEQLDNPPKEDSNE